ncbi:hypothetical protein TSMEX_001364 [Taenia solium]|eukprot:TsM_000380900 transcript=TsM_000380900 gene=TsM_000380900
MNRRQFTGRWLARMDLDCLLSGMHTKKYVRLSILQRYCCEGSLSVRPTFDVLDG